MHPRDTPERLEHVDRTAVEAAHEIQQIGDDELPETTLIRGQEFDHREWRSAEMDDALRERSELEKVIQVDGTVDYAD